MSRYIESEWLKGRVHNVTLVNGALHGCIDKLDIHEAPSIDICFCRECTWSKANGTYQWCGRLDSTARITADDFCSYGERIEP